MTCEDVKIEDEIPMLYYSQSVFLVLSFHAVVRTGRKQLVINQDRNILKKKCMG